MRSLLRQARTQLHRLSVRMGDRGRVLVPFAMLDLVYAYGLVTAPPRVTTSPTNQFLFNILPQYGWAALWGLTGVLAIIGIFADHEYKPGIDQAKSFWRSDWPAFLVAASLKLFLAVLLLIGDLFFGVERGYLSAVIWFAFAWFLASFLRRDTR